MSDYSLNPYTYCHVEIVYTKLTRGLYVYFINQDRIFVCRRWKYKMELYNEAMQLHENMLILAKKGVGKHISYNYKKIV